MLFLRILRKNILLGVLFFMLHAGLIAKPFFQMNAACLKAQSLIYELRVEEAETILTSEKKETQDNMAIVWLQEYCLYIRLFISENETEYKARQSEWKNYIQELEKISKNNPWFRFALSDMYLHRASVRLKMNDNWLAGSDIKTANTYLKENEKLYPEFLPDNKNLGLIKALCSAIPKNYAWLGNILGLEGSLDVGLQKINTYLTSQLNDNEHKWLKLETAFIYALLQHNFQKKSDEAWLTIEPYTREYKSNVLMNYMRATIAAYDGRNDEQIKILTLKPLHQKAIPFYYMDYMLGVAKLRSLQPDASIHFKLYTIKFKGKNYIKSAYRYLAWSEIINGNLNAANTYYSLCSKHGKAFQEEDKQAQKEALDPLKWPKELLEARLLFDGHYYRLSYDKLNKIEDKKLHEVRFLLELNYRKARIHQELKEFASALILFDKVIQMGQKQSYYYASYSALQMGLVYEQLKNKEQATYYFNKAIKDFPKNEEYVNSIEQKAKTGLKRICK